MIVVSAQDPALGAAVRTVARPDEQVVSDPRWVGEALQYGFPRLYVVAGARASHWSRRDIPMLHLSDERLRSWEMERRKREVPLPRLDELGLRMRTAISEVAFATSWVDRALADLARAAGGPLPFAFGSFARHVLEFPRHYTGLGALSDTWDLTRGALKARFRRRGLGSPFLYLRWCRVFAVIEALSDEETTIADAADRLGFTSGGNMCRSVRGLTGITPHRLRDPEIRHLLLFGFARRFLTPADRTAWRDLDDLFRARRVA